MIIHFDFVFRILRNKRIQKEKNKPKVGLLDALDGAVEDEASSEKDEIEVLKNMEKHGVAIQRCYICYNAIFSCQS